jgi:uncharacterized membrane protein
MSEPLPSDPASPNSPESAVAQPPASSAGTELQPNIAASLACFFSILGGIVFLVLEKKNKFVRFYAMQSVVFGVASFVAFFAFAIVATVIMAVMGKIPVIGALIGFFISAIYLVLFIGYWAVSIIAIMNAFKNKEWEIPYIGPFARKQLVSGPLSKL